VLGSYIFPAIALVTAGVLVGALAVVCLGIRSDDRRGRFPADTNRLVTRAARRMTGVGIRRTEETRDASGHQKTTIQA
jgi:hypothetical protein